MIKKITYIPLLILILLITINAFYFISRLGSNYFVPVAGSEQKDYISCLDSRGLEYKSQGETILMASNLVDEAEICSKFLKPESL